MSLLGELVNPRCTLFIFLVFFLSNKPFDFRSFFRFFHNQRSKESLLTHMVKDLEAYANAWADKFVDANLQPHLASWLRQLEDEYPEELLKLKARLEKTSFTTMGVTKNKPFAIQLTDTIELTFLLYQNKSAQDAPKHYQPQKTYTSRMNKKEMQ